MNCPRGLITWRETTLDISFEAYMGLKLSASLQRLLALWIPKQSNRMDCNPSVKYKGTYKLIDAIESMQSIS